MCASLFEHRRGRQHLLDRPARHARGADPRAAALGQSRHGQLTRHRARLQPARPLHHACAAAEQPRAAHWEVALLQVYGRWDVRRRRDCGRLCVVVHVFRGRAADHVFSAGMSRLHVSTCAGLIDFSRLVEFPPVRGAIPRDRVRDVHERDGAARDDDELVDPGDGGDVQRDELALGEREPAAASDLEEPVLGRRDHAQHGAALYDPLRPVLHGELADFFAFLSVLPAADSCFVRSFVRSC